MLQAAQQQLPVSAKNPGQKLENEKLSLSVASEAPSATDIKLAQPAQPAPKTETKPAVEEQPPIKPSPPPLLILDLNGCLLYREYQPGRPKIIHPRPHLHDLFQYALGPPADQGKHSQGSQKQNWEVLIWSSAQPKNVQLMCNAIEVQKRPKLSNRGQRATQLEDISNQLGSLKINHGEAEGSKKAELIPRRVLDIWDRNQLDLSSVDYGRKVSTTKDLRKIWDRLSWTDPESGKELKWDAHNTVIVDDSPDKLSLQPGNLCMISEFSGDSSDKSLLELVEKLKSLRNASDIPEAIKKLNEKATAT
ncbi:hypothetical protein PTTG_02897 [Puccinia triticina 1-1 BBBD Race 1]|uniref:Mitochondrial import inner membrane translocase subunit TIM50 n=2 Tax=Puccinia triticina TaxID=208348 RepID=A0A180GMZ9_PUCT1|nr:uncharacterized protein PtA15_1A947 [Puccinia triticina]OAV94090.1 hypothetical protein PTTG_02897 [Puccinia triticina 1-1 BBBD Race 1]WAQ81605.1 hypothetical protein PtA15_1A947 [Puccinia triticina]